MVSYRCYFLDECHHRRGTEDIEVDALGDAIDRALAMLSERSDCREIELWLGSERIYPPGSDLEDETTWLRFRIHRLRTILRFVRDPRGTTGLKELIAEAEDRLQRLETKGDYPPPC